MKPNSTFIASIQWIIGFRIIAKTPSTYSFQQQSFVFPKIKFIFLNKS